MTLPTLSDDAREPQRAPADILDTAQAGPRAIRGAALRTASYVASALLAAVSAPLLTRHLGDVRYGEYYAVGSLVALASGLTEGGLGTIGLREYAVLRGRERQRFLGNLLGMRLAFVGIGLAGGIVFAITAYPSILVAGTAIAGVGILIGVAQSTMTVPLYTELLIGRQVLFELLSQFVTVALVVTGVLVGASLLPFLFIPVPAGLLLLVLTARLVRSRASLAPAFELGRWWTIVKQTYPVAASTAVQTLYLRSVILVMTLITSPREWGIYAYSVRVMEILVGIPLLLVATTFPVVARAVRDDRVRLAYVMRRTLQAGLIVGLGMTLCTMIGAGLAMRILTGHSGSSAAAVLRVQAPALLLAFVTASWGSLLIALHRHHALLLSSGVALVLTTGLTAVLVPRYGAFGGGVASLAGELGLLTTLGIALLRSGDLHASRAGVPSVLLCAAVAAAAALLPTVPDLGRLIIFIVVYGGGLLLTGAVPAEIREAATDRIRMARR